jgi:hypothetical protein
MTVIKSHMTVVFTAAIVLFCVSIKDVAPLTDVVEQGPPTASVFVSELMS